MSVDVKKLAAQIEELPSDAQQAVEAFVKSLQKRQTGKKRHYLKQDWGGALSHWQDKYTSLELQKKTLEWRGD